MGSREDFTIRNFKVCTVHLIVRLIKSRRLRWAGHVARMKEGKTAFKILTGKPTGKRSSGKSRRRREDNIKWVLRK